MGTFFKIRICFYTLLVAGVLFGAYKNQVAAQLPYRITFPIGNVLCAHFYYLAKHDKTILDVYKMLAQTDMAPDLKTFYKRLTWYRKIPNIDFDSAAYSAWNQIDVDGSYKPNFLQFWQSLRPMIQKVYAKALPKFTVADPVVHFRCSDVPFTKHVHYHISTTESVRWMAHEITQRGYNNIVLLNCNKHLKNDYDSCAKYINYYKSIFTQAGLSVQTQCTSILNDFATMVHSPLLVSLNQGSFSFMAGVAKDPNTYISCNMGMELDGKYILQTEADWILDPRAPLLHANVVDYNQADTVITQLMKQ